MYDSCLYLIFRLHKFPEVWLVVLQLHFHQTRQNADPTMQTVDWQKQQRGVWLLHHCNLLSHITPESACGNHSRGGKSIQARGKQPNLWMWQHRTEWKCLNLEQHHRSKISGICREKCKRLRIFLHCKSVTGFNNMSIARKNNSSKTAMSTPRQWSTQMPATARRNNQIFVTGYLPSALISCMQPFHGFPGEIPSPHWSYPHRWSTRTYT